jgi:hypothetical protein
MPYRPGSCSVPPTVAIGGQRSLRIDPARLGVPTPALPLEQPSVGTNFGVRWRRNLCAKLSSSVPEAADVAREPDPWLGGIDPQDVHDPWRTRTREERNGAMVARFRGPPIHVGARESRCRDGRLRCAIARTVPALDALSRRWCATRTARGEGTEDRDKNDEDPADGSTLIHRCRDQAIRS